MGHSSGATRSFAPGRPWAMLLMLGALTGPPGCGAPPAPEIPFCENLDGYDPEFNADYSSLGLRQVVPAAPVCRPDTTPVLLAPLPLPARPASGAGCPAVDAFEDGGWLVSIVGRDAERGVVGAFFDAAVLGPLGGPSLREAVWRETSAAFETSPAPDLTIGTRRPDGRGEVVWVRLGSRWSGVWPFGGHRRPPTRSALVHALGAPLSRTPCGPVWRRGDVVIHLAWARPGRIRHISVWDAAAFDRRASKGDPCLAGR